MRPVAVLLFAVELLAEVALGNSLSSPTEMPRSTNQYHRAFVSVSDRRRGQSTESGATYITSVISQLLNERGIESTCSDDDHVDLHVICRYEHVFGRPTITPGFQLKTTFIGPCSLKIVDKKTGAVLVEKSYARKRGSGEVGDFIKNVFADWQTVGASNTTGKPAEGMTNAAPTGISASSN